MRAIDADALMEAINTWPKFGVDERCRIVPWDEGYEPYIRLRDAVIAITGMPTIEERKKGEWIEDADTFYKAVNEKGGGVNEDTPYFTDDDVACSECLTLFNVLENRTDIFDFCPHCGSYNGGNNDA